jgi:anti-sigma regulatory factor (Ser/Thr protein kinase)
MADWGLKPGSDPSDTVALLVAELSANAVRHGHARGHDRFQLALTHDAAARTVRIEVSDASPRHPPTDPPRPSPEDESGRGLLLVDVLAARWGTSRRVPLGKTIWADVATDRP